MLTRLLSIWSNILSPRAVFVLGLRQYLVYLGLVLKHSRTIIKERRMSALDQEISQHLPEVALRFKGRYFKVNLRETDAELQEFSKAFGSIRELFIRDCYLSDLGALPHLRVGVDLGSNRGIFSTFLASTCEQVLCVEPQPQYHDIICRNMALNGYTHFQIADCAIGTSKKLEGFPFPMKRLETLMAEHGLIHIDLLKIDIEGGEFDLFADPGWLNHVSMLTMELHPEAGDIDSIHRTLTAKGWRVTTRDRWLRTCAGTRDAEFLFARNPHC
jgi:hypothetical protein